MTPATILKIQIGLGLIAAIVVVRVVYKGVEIIKTDLNPADPENRANQAALTVGASLTGDKDFSLGGWLHEKFNSDPMEVMAEKERKLALAGKSDYDLFMEKLAKAWR